MGNKRKHYDDDESQFDPVSKHLQTAHIKHQEKRLIIILENAQLESVKIGSSFELLNCDDHTGILKKNNRDAGSCRPDIVHQCLLMLMDSPLNRAGLLQVYIHTEKNVLIEINPQTRIPRTFKRFAGLMVQLLHKYHVQASDKRMKLLKVIKNPITQHLPVGCKKLCMSYSAQSIKNPRDLVPEDEPITIIIGAMAHGQVKTVYQEETFSISNYPLSAAVTCSKICSGFEEVWGVV
ncbi:ribosomal RNA small subunit methyltransferase NEP1 [Phymastichus coffea]|uniref:ribosomal RNA small subunit methyltransferase NEP1 n=1 Tax=Phymastichus coffea TaxID=108790 RepID=UPI00273BFE8F|nr:ribosomal RNA small subunit methyltransferase NEP1 [Phymastichus coffea]XP_058809511.1 ribosomal RNA small subunit methyltransferase NEP1 [Phymastichus coffea]